MKMMHKQFSGSTGLGFVWIAWSIQGCAAPPKPPEEKPPQAVIVNEHIEALLYMPDAERGYYRGTRFDWSGVMASLEYNGHSYFGQWFDEYDPYRHDAILGPVEEFTPLGFDQAGPGEGFVKIGVGVLVRPDASDYDRFSLYEVASYGDWTLHTDSSQVEFIHEVDDVNGYSYRYHKVVKLPEGRAELVLEHHLENTGRRPIETSVYNHHFFVIDGEPTGPGIRTIFPFEVSGEGRGFGELVEVSGHELRYLRGLEDNEQVYSDGLRGFEDTPDDYDIRIENRKTGAGVRLRADRPIEKLVFWASSTTSCPEPYIRLEIQPGQSGHWTNTYTFYTNSTL